MAELDTGFAGAIRAGGYGVDHGGPVATINSLDDFNIH